MKRIMYFICAAVLITLLCGVAGAHSSQAWKKRIEARTATVWLEGQSLGDGIVLNARAELNFTRLEPGLVRELGRDSDVDEWVVENLVWYSSNRKEIREKMKGSDVLVLNYRAVKYWNFDPFRLTVNKRAVVSDDILTRDIYWDRGELPPGATGTVAFAVPSVKPGGRMEFQYDEDRAVLEVPVK